MSHTDNLAELATSLLAALATWAERDDSIPQPEVRQAGHAAVDLIDTIQRSLYAARAQLVGEICKSDRIAYERAGVLLAEIRKGA